MPSSVIRYYRYDPEQTPTGNHIPLVSKMLFRVSGDAHPLNESKGFLVDGLSLSSSNVPNLGSGTSTIGARK